IDSIKKVVALQKADTNKLINLLGLSGAYRSFLPDSSIVYAQKGLILAEKLQDEMGLFNSEVNLSRALMVAGNYPLELEYCFKALSLANRMGTPAEIAYANLMLSDCYYNLGDYATSLNYIRKVAITVGKLYPDAMYQVWTNLSRIFGGLRQPDSAVIYALKAYEGMKKDPCLSQNSYEFQLKLCLLSPIIGDAFAGKAWYDSALCHYRLGLSISGWTYQQTDMIDNYNGIAGVYKNMGRLDSAAWYAERVLSEKITKTYPAGLLKAANMLAAIYESKNNADSTLKYERMAIRLKDSLFNREKTITIQNLTYREQEKQKEIEASRIQVQNRFKLYLLLAGLGAIAVIAAIQLKNRRQKQLQKIRNSIADDLHDDIGSTLSSISILNELAKQRSPEALPLLASIGESTLALQENMSDIVWAVNPQNDHFENILQRMNQFAAEILDAKNIELDFVSAISTYTSKLSMSQRKNFYLFFKEAINNAAKYSGAKKVNVSIAQKDHHIEMSISDNGNGFDPEKTVNGNGMTTLKKRAAELNADFSIRSCLNAGTAIRVRFKIT
ncbi:MAG TPA: ATP-binding protein, partial [Puia sp.]|nr:ATP-binding protein [Puia sp.]